MHKKPRTTLAKQLFSNYIILLMLIIGILFLSFVGNGYFVSNFLDKTNINTNKFYKAVETEGLSYACQNYYIPEDAYIEIVNEKLEVVESYQGKTALGYKYSKTDFYNILFENTVNSFAYYLADKNQILIIHVSEVYLAIRVIKSIIFTFLMFLILFILSVIILSKYTSLRIIKPLEALLVGVHSISTGHYDYKILVPANNELEDLRIAINDLSEKLKVEIALKEKAEKSRQQLILDITHDLKTPITNIIGYCDTLKQIDCKNSEVCDKYLDIIVQNSNKANQMTQDLFELSHLESTDFKLNLERFEFTEFLRELIINFIPAMENLDMELEIDIPEKNIYLNLDKLKMERAISNLFSNSIKYSGKNSRLNIVLKHLDENIELVVKDNGCGIPKEYEESIFEPFLRLDPSRNSKTGGTGLGLAITKKIIERHDGSISLISDVDSGCEFKINLPI